MKKRNYLKLLHLFIILIFITIGSIFITLTFIDDLSNKNVMFGTIMAYVILFLIIFAIKDELSKK